MIVIGITGKAKSGKDAMVEEYLKRPDHPLTQRLAFADGVKHSASAIFRESVGMFYEHKEEISEQWGISYREMLQKLGTDFARDMIDKDFWVKWLDSKLKTIPTSIGLVFVTDVRFDNEAKWIHSQGGAVIEVLRSMDSILTPTQEQHSSEDGISSELIDYHIINDSSLEQLGLRLAMGLETMGKLRVV